MKKLICTAKGYEGELVVIYGPDGMLLLFDVQGTNMAASQVDYFKRHCPTVISKVDEFKSQFNTLTVVEEGYDITFEMFWERYGRKVHANRCEPLWKKLSVGDRVKAFTGILAYDRHLSTNTWKSKADPEAYLKKRYWETEWSKIKQ